jgi:hypothetical protein
MYQEAQYWKEVSPFIILINGGLHTNLCRVIDLLATVACFGWQCENSSNGKSSSFSGALRPGTAPVYTDRRHLGYDASKGQKFRVSRLGVSPMGEGAFGEEDGDAQVMLLDELYAAKELMSPYLQQYRELPKSSAESKLLTRQLGTALVEQQWNRSQDGVEAWYPPRY